MEIKDKVVIVTGASEGIGAALAEKLKLRSTQRVLFTQTVGWPEREK